MVEEAVFISVKHCVQKKWPHCRSRGQRSVELRASSQRGHDIENDKVLECEELAVLRFRRLSLLRILSVIT